MRRYAEVHQTKLLFRDLIDALSPNVLDQSFVFGGDPWKSKLVACADDWFYSWFSGNAVASSARDACFSMYDEVLGALGRVAAGSSIAVPVSDLVTALNRLKEIESTSALAPMSCAERSRLVELPAAIESYARTSLQAAQSMSDVFPVTDIPVSGSCNVVRAIGRPSLGEVAVELQKRHDAGEETINIFVPFVVYCNQPIIEVFKHTLRNAMQTSLQYHELLEHRTNQHLWTAEELAPITLLNEEFLTTHPQFQQLHASLLVNLRKQRRAVVWAGIGCGLASVTGTLLLGGIAGLAVGGALCVAEAFAVAGHAIETSYLYQLARTFRYFGVETPLETFARTTGLGSQSRLEWAFAIASFGLASFDIGAAIGRLRQLRIGHAAGFEARPMFINGMEDTAEPIFLGNDIVVHFRAKLAEASGSAAGQPKMDLFGRRFDNLQVPGEFDDLDSYLGWLVARVERADLVRSDVGYVPDIQCNADWGWCPGHRVQYSPHVRSLLILLSAARNFFTTVICGSTALTALLLSMRPPEASSMTIVSGGGTYCSIVCYRQEATLV